jgi:hypothetical protein
MTASRHHRITAPATLRANAPQLHGGCVPFWQTTVVVEPCGTTTVVVFCGGGGLLLLMQPDSAASMAIETSNVFICHPVRYRMSIRVCSMRCMRWIR